MKLYPDFDNFLVSLIFIAAGGVVMSMGGIFIFIGSVISFIFIVNAGWYLYGYGRKLTETVFSNK